MPGTARVVIPDVPLHVMQRGNRFEDVFFGKQDRLLFLRPLSRCAPANALAINAYCPPRRIFASLRPDDQCFQGTWTSATAAATGRRGWPTATTSGTSPPRGTPPAPAGRGRVVRPPPRTPLRQPAPPESEGQTRQRQSRWRKTDNRDSKIESVPICPEMLLTHPLTSKRIDQARQTISSREELRRHQADVPDPNAARFLRARQRLPALQDPSK